MKGRISIESEADEGTGKYDDSNRKMYKSSVTSASDVDDVLDLIPRKLTEMKDDDEVIDRNSEHEQDQEHERERDNSLVLTDLQSNQQNMKEDEGQGIISVKKLQSKEERSKGEEEVDEEVVGSPVSNGENQEA